MTNVLSHLGIYRIRPDGSALEPITDSARNVSYPGWSPDGEWFYFVEDAFNDPTLVRLRVDGSTEEVVDFTPGRDFPPQFSPITGRGFNPFWLLIIAAGLMLLSFFGRLRP